MHLRRTAQDQGHGAAGRLQFQACLHPFQQFLFHQRRPDACRHRKCHPHRRRISPGRTHRTFCAAGNRRRFSRRRTGSTPDWTDGDTANLCIGQGEVAVTPVQMAVMISAIANGGKVFWPRLVDRIEPQDPASGEAVTNFPSGVVRDESGRASAQPANPARRDAGRRAKQRRHGHGRRGGWSADLRQDRHGGGAGRTQPRPSARISGSRPTRRMKIRNTPSS